jgi:hypothetical protein
MNVLQEIALAIDEASGGFSDSTSHRDMFRRVAEAIERRARRHPDFSAGHAVSNDLLNKTTRNK